MVETDPHPTLHSFQYAIVGYHLLMHINCLPQYIFWVWVEGNLRYPAIIKKVMTYFLKEQSSKSEEEHGGEYINTSHIVSSAKSMAEEQSLKYITISNHISSTHFEQLIIKRYVRMLNTVHFVL